MAATSHSALIRLSLHVHMLNNPPPAERAPRPSSSASFVLLQVMSQPPQDMRHALAAVAPVCCGLAMQIAGRVAAAVLQGGGRDRQQLDAVLQLASQLGRSSSIQGSTADVQGELQAAELWALAAAAASLLRAVDGKELRPQQATATAAIVQLHLPALAAEARAPAAADSPTVNPSLPRQQELLELIAELVAAFGCWDVGLALVQAVTVPSTQPQHQQQKQEGHEAAAAAAAALPYDVGLQLAAAVIQQASLALSGAGGLTVPEQQQPSQGQVSSKDVLQHAISHNLPQVLALLTDAEQQPHPPPQPQQRGQPRQRGSQQQAVTQYMLPALLGAAVQLGAEKVAAQELNKTCR